MTFIDSSEWFCAGGGIAGRSHLQRQQGSQDALLGRRFPGGVVAVVCDGCSAAKSAAVGAGVGVRVVCAAVPRLLAAGVDVAALPAAVIGELVSELDRLATLWGGDDHAQREAVIADALVFTVVAAVVAGDDVVVVGVGDGRVRVNGVDIDIGGCRDGAPDAPAYALVPGLEAHAVCHVHFVGKSADVDSIVVGSDGAHELYADVVAALEADDALADNATLLSKRLQVQGPRWDDCSLAILRRLPRSPSCE